MSEMTPAQLYALVRLFQSEQGADTTEFKMSAKTAFRAKEAREGGTIRKVTLTALINRKLVYALFDDYRCLVLSETGRMVARDELGAVEKHEREMARRYPQLYRQHQNEGGGE